MNVALVTQRICEEDGQGKVNREIMRELLDRGHSIHLIATSCDPEMAAEPRVRWSRIETPRLPAQLLTDQVFAWRASRLIRGLGDGIDVRVINGFCTWSATDVNIIHYVHDGAWRALGLQRLAGRLTPGGANQVVYTWINRYLEAWTFRRSQLVVAVSNSVRDDLIVHGVAADRIHVVTNGIDTGTFHPGPARREALGLPEGVPLALFVGDIRTDRKNLGTVLRAMADVDDLHLAVAGDHADSVFPTEAEALGVGRRTVFLGRRDDVPDIMRAVDIFVLPSRYEPCGLVALEAAATGLPVILSLQAGAADILGGAASILLDDCDDHTELASALWCLMADPDLRARLGSAGRRAVVAASGSRMAAHHADIIEQAARRAKSQRQMPRAAGRRVPGNANEGD